MGQRVPPKDRVSLGITCSQSSQRVVMVPSSAMTLRGLKPCRAPSSASAGLCAGVTFTAPKGAGLPLALDPDQCFSRCVTIAHATPSLPLIPHDPLRLPFPYFLPLPGSLPSPHPQKP